MNNRLIQHIGFAGLLMLAACGDKKDAKQQQQGPPPATPVAAYEVKEEDATYFDQYPATLTALNEVEIRPQVSGYITGIYFKEGQQVKKGMKLYSIDQRQYQAAYQEAIANLNSAKANTAKAQQDADRYNYLAKQDAIAKQTLDHAVADLQSSKMGVAAAEANVNSVKTTLSYSTIYAPLSGTIGISQFKLGAAIAPGQSVLNTISSNDPMAVDFAVDQKEIVRFSQLQQKGTSPGDSTFSLVLPDQSIFPYPGHIYFIDRAVDPQTGTITARVVFPNTKGLLKPGMSTNIRVKNNSAVQKVLIPFKAVTEQMGEYFVFAIDSSKAVQKKVSLGTRINEKVIILSGLKAGEQIITEGTQKLKDGSPVKVTGAARDSSATAPNDSSMNVPKDSAKTAR